LVAAQPRKLVPRASAVGRAEQRGILDARVDEIGVVRRGLEVPDARELPRMLRAVVPHVRGERAAGLRRGVVHELVALAARHAAAVVGGHGIVHRSRLLPGPAAVARALDDLAEPATRLRRVDAVGIRRRSLHVVHLPAREVRPGHGPLLALAVRREDEGALAGADQYPDCGHWRSPLGPGPAIPVHLAFGRPGAVRFDSTAPAAQAPTYRA